MGFFGIFPKKSYNFSTNLYYIDIKTDLESLQNLFTNSTTLIPKKKTASNFDLNNKKTCYFRVASPDGFFKKYQFTTIL